MIFSDIIKDILPRPSSSLTCVESGRANSTLSKTVISKTTLQVGQQTKHTFSKVYNNQSEKNLLYVFESCLRKITILLYSSQLLCEASFHDFLWHNQIVQLGLIVLVVILIDYITFKVVFQPFHLFHQYKINTKIADAELANG